VKKCINELNRNISKEEVKMAQNHEEIFNIPGLRRSAHKNHIKIPP
jgi:hypothetical protein